jgi:hypothetical protein
MAHAINKHGISICTLLRDENTRLGWRGSDADGLRRLKAGERQQRCARCLCYTWPDTRQRCEDFVADGPVLDSAADEAAIKALIDEDDAWQAAYHAPTGE